MHIVIAERQKGGKYVSTATDEKYGAKRAGRL